MTDFDATTLSTMDRAKSLAGPWSPQFSLEGTAVEPTSSVSATPVVETRTEAQMIAIYSTLVRQIAGGFQRRLPRNVLRDDLVAAGMSGLLDAVSI